MTNSKQEPPGRRGGEIFTTPTEQLSGTDQVAGKPNEITVRSGEPICTCPEPASFGHEPGCPCLERPLCQHCGQPMERGRPHLVRERDGVDVCFVEPPDNSASLRAQVATLQARVVELERELANATAGKCECSGCHRVVNNAWRNSEGLWCLTCLAQQLAACEKDKARLDKYAKLVESEAAEIPGFAAGRWFIVRLDPDGAFQYPLPSFRAAIDAAIMQEGKTRPCDYCEGRGEVETAPCVAQECPVCRGIGSLLPSRTEEKQ